MLRPTPPIVGVVKSVTSCKTPHNLPNILPIYSLKQNVEKLIFTTTIVKLEAYYSDRDAYYGLKVMS